MVTHQQVLQKIYDELKIIVDNNTSVTDLNKHVGYLDRDEDYRTPFFGFEWTINPNDIGLGGNVRVISESYLQNGDLDSIQLARDYEMIIDFGVVVEGDDPGLRDDYMSAVQDHFADFVHGTKEIHSHVRRMDDEGAIPAGIGDSRDSALRQTYSLEYYTTTTQDITAAETVDWEVDVDGVDAYPENY